MEWWSAYLTLTSVKIPLGTYIHGKHVEQNECVYKQPHSNIFFIHDILLHKDRVSAGYSAIVMRVQSRRCRDGSIPVFFDFIAILTPMILALPFIQLSTFLEESNVLVYAAFTV